MEKDHQKMSSRRLDDTCNRKQSVDNVEDEDDTPLPGFRFHPTDEELVDFYLRRKVEKRPISIELIKHIDIYKYDPWDLPSTFTVNYTELFYLSSVIQTLELLSN